MSLDLQNGRKERSSIQSVERAFSILEAIAAEGGEGSLSDIARRVGLNVSTCHHLLSTLVQRGYATKIPHCRRYGLGARLLRLGHACTHADLPKLAGPLIEQIGKVTGETVYLSVLQGDNFLNLLRRLGSEPLRNDAGKPGYSNAIHATATGKSILAWLPESEIQRIVALNGFQRFTPQTITKIEVLIEHLRNVRRHGYALDREEYQPGVICIGAPIRDHVGSVLGSISISTATKRASRDHLDMLRQLAVKATMDLSANIRMEGATG